MKTKKKTLGRVLIIEDEPALRDIYSTKMQMEGYDVAEAKDGLDGFDQAVHDGADIVLLDIMMPVKNGFEVLHDLKMNPKTKDIPVILLTNLGQDYEVKKGIELGAETFLTKSNITPAKVADHVKAIIAKHQASEAHHSST
ncbi:MAG: hypothetical protein RLZZ324_1226 [Candidatus Parcubacteria bacterium]